MACQIGVPFFLEKVFHFARKMVLNVLKFIIWVGEYIIDRKRVAILSF